MRQVTEIANRNSRKNPYCYYIVPVQREDGTLGVQTVKETEFKAEWEHRWIAEDKVKKKGSE